MSVIYLDHHATTPCSPAVVEAMVPYFAEHFGNAGSRQHTLGLHASAAVDVARERVAEAVGAQPHEIVFTSGATESNNLAILGTAEACDGPRHVITGATEHKAVLAPVAHLAARHGWATTVLQPDAEGRISADQVRDALRDDTALVSLMTANNETGVCHPIAAIAAVCAEAGVTFHTDAAQGLGRLPIDVTAGGIDMVSLTAHKIYGPKGIGALWVRRRGRPRVRLAARQHGGGQERDLRSGTLSVPLIVGFGVAAQEAVHGLGDMARQADLRDRLRARLEAEVGARTLGSTTHRLPNNLLVSVPGIRSAALIQRVRSVVALSAGSACSTDNPKPSHVLLSMGVEAEEALSVLRFGLGRTTTDAQIQRAADAIRDAVAQLS